MSASETPPDANRGLRILLAVALAALALGLYARTTGFEFVNYDDYDYVVRNKVVQEGLGERGLELAFKGGHSSNWHPLTTLSHLLDVELFGHKGAAAGGSHHITNVLLHGLNAALCFLALFGLTRRLWLAAFVASLFALHPQRVESVAWISERKDLLSGCFFFLVLIAWTRYAKRPSVVRYLWVCLGLALGLMSKQMLVTLPFLLVLLDIGPLQRWAGSHGAQGGKSLPGLLLEKLPLLLLSALSIIPMWISQAGAGTMGNLGLLVRLENALASIWRYIAQTLWPASLSPFYPHPRLVDGDTWNNLHLPAILGATLLLGLGFVAIKRLRRSPKLAVGWFWYVGMLLPVIGLVQVGSQSHADRYTYLPSIGLYLICGWSLGWLIRRRPALARPIQGLCLLALGVLFGLSWKQSSIWKNSKTLNRHALEVTEHNYVAHNNYGLYLLEEASDPVLAAQHFQKALAIRSNYMAAMENLGLSYNLQQRNTDAMEVYTQILLEDPSNARALARLSQLSANRGDDQAAFNLLEKSTQMDPSNAKNWVELGFMRLERAEGIHAEGCAAKALKLEPNNTRAHVLHARAARMLGYAEAAVTRIQAAVDSDPSNIEALLTQCRIYADQQRLVEAEEVCEALLKVDEHNVQGHILRGKFLMLRFKSGQMNAQANGQDGSIGQELFEQAKQELLAALSDAPNNPEALEFYGLLLMDESLFDEAEEQFLLALEERPDFPSTLNNLGGLYEGTGREAQALVQYQRLMETASDSPNARYTARALAWILATSPDESVRDGEEAVRMGTFAMRSFRDLKMDEAETFVVLAAAFARVGRWDDALKYQDVAIKLAPNESLRTIHRKRLELYRSEQPFTRASQE